MVQFGPVNPLVGRYKFIFEEKMSLKKDANHNVTCETICDIRSDIRSCKIVKAQSFFNSVVNKK